MKVIRTDCLVIGAGLAGSAYALHAAKAGHQVELLSLGSALEANSDWAQGGIIYDTTPHPESLSADIMAASAGTANPAAIAQLVSEGPGAVKGLLLDELQVPFDRDAGGELDFAREGGHAIRRIIHAHDSTGHSILAAVACRIGCTPGITRREGLVAVDLLTLSHNSTTPVDRYEPLTCFGCYALDTASGEVMAIVAKKTILATGGLGGIYRHSTNQLGSVGHGVAMAYRIGARLIDLEYVQFHPTVFLPRSGMSRPFLVTEALRGEGAVLVDSHGRRFLDAVHPLGSLAPRDVVARAIQRQLSASGESRVYLDLSALDPAFIRNRFPSIHAYLLGQGLDCTREKIPVVPAAHFSCGGVHADLQGRTNIRNLNAIGETACTGLHGANRLASTSLLECLVTARAAALADEADLAREYNLPEPRVWICPTSTPDLLLLRQDLDQMRETMWNYAGIIRSPHRLVRARRMLQELRESVDLFYRDCRPTRELIELRNGVQTALLVVHAASLNPISKGCHYLEEERVAPAA